MTLATGAEDALFVDIAFWVIAVSSIVAAVAVVQLRDVFRAALFLVVSFLGVAGMFILLRAEFLAAVQVLVYVGAISVLILFAILMTQDTEQGNPSNLLRIPALIVSGLFLAAAVFVAVTTEWTLIGDYVELPGTPAVEAEAIRQESANVFSGTIPVVGKLLIRDYVLAFEVASVLLLAAVVGALALVRER